MTEARAHAARAQALGWCTIAVTLALTLGLMSTPGPPSFR